jgi:hypothetical protein
MLTWRWLFKQAARCIWPRTAFVAGSNSAINMPMIVMTTSNSMSVKPRETRAGRPDERDIERLRRECGREETVEEKTASYGG